GLKCCHLLNIENDTCCSLPDFLSDGAALHQYFTSRFQMELLNHKIRATLDRFRAGLNNIKLTIETIQRPFDIHRPLVMLLDDHRLAGKGFNLCISQTKMTTALCSNRASSGFSFCVIHHLDCFRAELAREDGRQAFTEIWLVNNEFIRIN